MDILDILRLLAPLTKTEWDDKLLAILELTLNNKTSSIEVSDKIDIAKMLTQNTEQANGLDVAWTEKEGFKISTSIKF